VGTPPLAVAAVIATMLTICVPASKMVAWVIEGKRNTFSIAGAAFLASVVMPPGLLVARRVLWNWFDVRICAMPVLAAAAIAYALSEAIGRMACLSFGCCYGKPVREARPRLARLFARFPLVFHGSTKKAAYDSGLAEEPLIPVQTITAVMFTLSGLVGLGLFLAEHWRLAAIVPVLATWGWRALSECLRADHRGNSRISVYQVMALIAMTYLAVMLAVLPSDGTTPNLAAGLAQVTSSAVIVILQVLWVALFLYYGRSRVTGSVISFHVVAERV
jgi:Prolipoprotein diacylglyceryl transferase